MRNTFKEESTPNDFNVQTKNSGSKNVPLWTSWDDYRAKGKIVSTDDFKGNSQEYVLLNGLYYTRHAVERMMPGSQHDAGRSIGPQNVEYIIDNAKEVDISNFSDDDRKKLSCPFYYKDSGDDYVYVADQVEVVVVHRNGKKAVKTVKFNSDGWKVPNNKNW